MTHADDKESVLADAIAREAHACLRAQRLTLALLTLGAGVAGYAAGALTTYKLMRRRSPP